MIDSLYLVVFAACLLGVGLLAYYLGTLGERRHAADVLPEVVVLPSEDLDKLRHLQAQLDHPPISHEHVWPREPDRRKMGWLRYTCAYAGCTMFRWERGVKR